MTPSTISMPTEAFTISKPLAEYVWLHFRKEMSIVYSFSTVDQSLKLSGPTFESSESSYSSTPITIPGHCIVEIKCNHHPGPACVACIHRLPASCAGCEVAPFDLCFRHKSLMDQAKWIITTETINQFRAGNEKPCAICILNCLLNSK